MYHYYVDVDNHNLYRFEGEEVWLFIIERCLWVQLREEWPDVKEMKQTSCQWRCLDMAEAMEVIGGAINGADPWLSNLCRSL